MIAEIITAITYYLPLFGTILAITGSCFSIYGTLLNNLYHNHIRAMEIWRFSNIFLCVWAGGNLLGFWNGGVSAAFLLVMYLVFSVTNWYGLVKYRKQASKNV